MRNRSAWILALVLGASVSGVFAENLRYAIQLPEERPVTYELDVDVRNPGKLSIHAEWTGGRSMSLKLTPPGRSYGALLRSGPSPLDVSTEVAPGSAEVGIWHFRIHALADRGPGEGMLVIDTPEPVTQRPAPEPVQEVTVPVEPWMQPPELPPRVPVYSLPFLEATEDYRRAIVGEPGSPPTDVCSWQSDLMRYLDRQRRRLLEDAPPKSTSTIELLLSMVEVIDAVESIRTSDDPLVAGPAPSDTDMRNGWIRLRRRKIDPVEADLDEILRRVRNDYAAELEEEQWPIRFVSCLTACERFFEQQTRLGEERAENRELARSQWPRIVAASRALAALADLRAAGESPD